MHLRAGVDLVEDVGRGFHHPYLLGEDRHGIYRGGVGALDGESQRGVALHDGVDSHFRLAVLIECIGGCSTILADREEVGGVVGDGQRPAPGGVCRRGVYGEGHVVGIHLEVDHGRSIGCLGFLHCDSLDLLLNIELLGYVAVHRDAGVRLHPAADEEPEGAACCREVIFRLEMEALVIPGLCRIALSGVVGYCGLAVSYGGDGSFKYRGLCSAVCAGRLTGDVDVVAVEGSGVHVGVKLHIHAVGLRVGEHFGERGGACALQPDIDLELRRGHGKPFGEGCLVTLLLEAHLPLSLGHIPGVAAVLAGEEGILLGVFLRVPFHGVPFDLSGGGVSLPLAVVDGGLHTLDAVGLHALVDEARGVDDGHHVGRHEAHAVVAGRRVSLATAVDYLDGHVDG